MRPEVIMSSVSSTSVMAADGWWLDGRMNDMCSCFLPQSTLKGANVTVFGCLNHGMPLFLRENSSLKCESGKSDFTLTASHLRYCWLFPQNIRIFFLNEWNNNNIWLFIHSLLRRLFFNTSTDSIFLFLWPFNILNSTEFSPVFCSSVIIASFSIRFTTWHSTVLRRFLKLLK